MLNWGLAMEIAKFQYSKNELDQARIGKKVNQPRFATSHRMVAESPKRTVISWFPDKKLYASET